MLTLLRKSLILTLVKQRQNFLKISLSWWWLFFPEWEKKSESRTDTELVENWHCIEGISKKFECEEVLSKGNVYNFSLEYNAIIKSKILNIYKYLMVKNNIK